ncbi:metal ABC transporter permease [Candidatus Woesearchaeota archaeon]|nr:metal ABC transporter permease [Candidatus Woesearchaeota archaeon]
MLEILGYSFMQKALLTGVVIAIACSLLGVFLVLRRYSLIGDGLAHISFGGIALGLLFGVAPVLFALAFAALSAIAILKIKEKARIQGDTAIGIVSHAALGLGIFIISIARGFNVDMLSYLFGSILAISTLEVITSVLLAGAVVALIMIFYHDLTFVAFDEDSAKASGIDAGFLNTLLIVLTAVTIVSAMKVTGLLLASSLIVLPAASSLQVAKSFRKALFFSALIAIVSVVAGLALAYHFDFAASGTIVLLNFVFFCILFAVRSFLRR